MVADDGGMSGIRADPYFDLQGHIEIVAYATGNDGENYRVRIPVGEWRKLNSMRLPPPRNPVAPFSVALEALNKYIAAKRAIGDPDGPLVALPAKPAPKEEPPYVPRKFGEHG